MEVSGQLDAPSAANRTAGLDVTPCQLVNIYGRFERGQCLHKHRCVNCIPRWISLFRGCFNVLRLESVMAA
jgi:hypothetical protein